MVKKLFPNALDISNEDYHRDTSRISKSGCDKISVSPAHYYAAYLDPERPGKEDTAALIVGKCAHVSVFERHLYADEVAVAPECDRRTTDGKTIWNNFIATAAKKTILDKKDGEMIESLTKAVHAHPAAAVLLREGYAEQTFHFVDDETGVACKIRPDWLVEIGGRWYIVDLKTTEDASPYGFGYSSLKYKYDKAAAMYLDGFYAATGIEAAGFILIAAEKKSPWAVAVYEVTEDVVHEGRQKYKRDLRRYKECKESGRWPAYGDEITPLQFPTKRN